LTQPRGSRFKAKYWRIAPSGALVFASDNSPAELRPLQSGHGAGSPGHGGQKPHMNQKISPKPKEFILNSIPNTSDFKPFECKLAKAQQFPKPLIIPQG
jgi:hypothetical protein